MALNAHALKVALEQYERGTHYKKGAVQRRLRKQRKQKLAQDIASFTHAKPAKEKFLRQSQTWGISAVTPELRAIMRGTLAGQDYSLVLHPVPGDVRQTMSLVLDGHGEDGELFAVHGGEYLAKQLEIVWDQVRSACYSNDDSQVTEICKMAFQETEQYLGRTLGGNSGGSTATVAMIVDGTYIVTANVGDSPAFLCFENGTHRMLTASHSADSAEEYTRYRARCAHAGVTPAEFVFNRFNCPGGHRMAGPNGEYAPLAIFTLDQNNQAVPIEDNLRYVDTLGHHGGIQSVRKHVVKDSTGKAIATQREMRHMNWGSTVAGRPQNTRMLGDWVDKAQLYLDAEPSVNMIQIDRSVGTTWLMVASDGVADAHWFEEISTKMVERAQAGVATAQAQCEAIVVDTINNARDAKFNFKDELPAWDDLALTLISPPADSDPFDTEVEAMEWETKPMRHVRRKARDGSCSPYCGSPYGASPRDARVGAGAHGTVVQAMA